MSERKIFIRGRSIDGTVYWCGDGWSTSVVGAIEIRNELAAERAIQFLELQLNPMSLDDTIGRLHSVTLSAEYVEKAYNQAMAEAYEESCEGDE